MATCIFLFRLFNFTNVLKKTRDKHVLSNVKRSHVEVCYSTINDMHLSPSSFTLAFLITAAENVVKISDDLRQSEREKRVLYTFIYIIVNK